jgi:predicted metalloprotease
VPFRGLRVGLLISGIASLLVVLAGTAPADAALTANGSGMTVTVVSAHLAKDKLAVNVNFAVSCTTANDNDMAADPADTWNLLFGFTLTENVKGTIVSYQSGIGSGSSSFFFPPITCDGTTQLFTDTLLPQNCASFGNCTPGTTAYKPGSALLSNLSVGAYDSDASCGIDTQFNFPNSCDFVSNASGGVQISG